MKKVWAKVKPEALWALQNYKDDVKAGHKDAQLFWRGQAGAYFTANPDKQLWEMPRAEFIQAYQNRFVKIKGKRRIQGILSLDGVTIYRIKDKDQSNGRLTRSADDVLSELHLDEVKGQKRQYDRVLSGTALHYERNTKPVPAEVLKDYPNMQNNPILPMIGNAAVTGVGLGVGFSAVNYLRDKMLSNPTLKFPVKSRAQLKHIFEAENHLRQAGVLFDTGSDIKNSKPTSRDWELDYSLSGAKIANPSHVKKLKTLAKSTGGKYKRKVQPDGMILHTVTYEDGDA